MKLKVVLTDIVLDFLIAKHLNVRSFPDRKALRAELRHHLFEELTPDVTSILKQRYPCTRCLNSGLTGTLKRLGAFPVNMSVQPPQQDEEHYIDKTRMTDIEVFQWCSKRYRGALWDLKSIRQDLTELSHKLPDRHIDVDGWMTRLRRAVGFDE